MLPLLERMVFFGVSLLGDAGDVEATEALLKSRRAVEETLRIRLVMLLLFFAVDMATLQPNEGTHRATTEASSERALGHKPGLPMADRHVSTPRYRTTHCPWYHFAPAECQGKTELRALD